MHLPPSQIVLVPVMEIYIKICFCSCIRLFGATHNSWCLRVLASHIPLGRCASNAACYLMCSCPGFNPQLPSPSPQISPTQPPSTGRMPRRPQCTGGWILPTANPARGSSRCSNQGAPSLPAFPGLEELISPLPLRFSAVKRQ